MIAAAVFALTLAGVMVWFHGFSRGVRYNDLEVAHAQRKVAAAHRMVTGLRGQVAILEAGMLRAPTDLWDDFDRSGS